MQVVLQETDSRHGCIPQGCRWRLHLAQLPTTDGRPDIDVAMRVSNALFAILGHVVHGEVVVVCVVPVDGSFKLRAHGLGFRV